MRKYSVRRFNDSACVSSLVRLKVPLKAAGKKETAHYVNEIGMIVSQSKKGSERYGVMFPGDPWVFYLRVQAFEVLQGRELKPLEDGEVQAG